MLSVVVWRWGDRYGVEYVNRLRAMLARHLRLPHQLFCITDAPAGLDHGIVPVTMPDPQGFGRARRLWVYSDDAQRRFGPRMLLLDIDCVIVGDVTPLVDRQEPLVAWRNPPEVKFSGSDQAYHSNEDGRVGAYNASIILLTAGVFPNIWSEYLIDRAGLEARAKASGFWTVLRTVKDGSITTRYLESGDDDQAVVSLYLRVVHPPTWTEADGVYKIGRRGFGDPKVLPENARIVFFNGSLASNRKTMEDSPWIAEYWR